MYLLSLPRFQKILILKPTMSAFNEETVLSVHHWTDRLFSFTTTRDASLRFSNGHFTMIGLRINDKPLLRAYSIVSANYEEHLEFLSIKVEDGPLTSKLQHIKVGDSIVVGRKPTGTLLIDYLLPAKRLYMFSSGTGLAPFLSVIRDPETYEKFEEVILVHSVRDVAELAYHDYITQELPQHEFLGEMVTKQLRYYPTVTREQYKQMGRITTLIENEKLFKDLGVPALDRTQDGDMRATAALQTIECCFDFSIAGFGIFLQKCGRGHHPAIDAMATLRHLLF